MIIHPSPNFNDRKDGAKVKYLILHYTGMATGGEALERLCDQKAGVSAHYLIEEDGRVFSLVAEDKRAWHAGVASWEEDQDINGWSIGIELVNPGHDGPGYQGDYRDFPESQMRSLIILCKDILGCHEIKPWHILGHSDVAPDRKSDPGEKFNWQRLADEGIGVWPDVGQPDEIDIATLQDMLRQYGYGVRVTGKLDRQTRIVLRAFQRHFRPSDFRGQADAETAALIKILLELKTRG